MPRNLKMVQMTTLYAYKIKLGSIKNFHFSAKGSPLRKKISKIQLQQHNFFPRNRSDLIISANWASICQNYYADRKSKLTAQISRTKDRSDPNFRIIARLWRPTYLLQPNYSSSRTYVQIAALRVMRGPIRTPLHMHTRCPLYLCSSFCVSTSAGNTKRLS